MGIDQRLRDVEDGLKDQKKDFGQLSTAVDKVCGAMETAMKIQTEHSIHLAILQKIVYGAVAICLLAIGGAVVDLVIRSNVPAKDRMDRIEMGVGDHAGETHR